jgi:hypothetical protein
MQNKIIPAAIFGYFVVMLAALLAMGLYWNNFEKPPEQPIKFPHDIHAGKLNLPCQHCHQYADKSIHAGIPAMSICMDCHKTAARDRPEVQKLIKYWEDKKPIPWVKVHGFRKNANVGFNHKRHIKAGIDCSHCHGDMKVTRVVRRAVNLKMGFCVSCHRANAAPTDCWTCHK